MFYSSSSTDAFEAEGYDEFVADQRRFRRSSGKAPSVIYPEILVLVDYDGYL